MRRYETIFILRPTLSENEITTVVDNTLQIIGDDKGSIIELDKWGMRKLAYPIKKEKQAFYVFLDFCSPAQSVTEIERKFRIDDAVLKYLTVKISESISKEEIAAAQEEVAKKKAAAQAAVDAAQEENLVDESDSVETETVQEDSKNETDTQKTEDTVEK